MKHKSSREDQYLWWLNTQDVKALKEPATKPKNAYPPLKTTPSIIHPLSGHNESSETLIKIKSRQALRKMAVEAQIDLHGYTHDGAWNALVHFFCKAQEQGKRAVLVITGKGSVTSDQTLRVQVPRWLEEPLFSKYIRGYQQSLQKDGGTGAYYVYLKRKK